MLIPLSSAFAEDVRTALVTKTELDTVVVSRYDWYEWDSTTWAYRGCYLNSYDASGRVIRTQIKTGNDSLAGTSTIEYDERGVEIRMTTTGAGNLRYASSANATDTERIVCSAYPHNRNFPLLSMDQEDMSTLGLEYKTNWDSVKTLTTKRRASRNTWDTTNSSSIRYFRENGVLKYSIGFYRMDFMSGTLRYDYSFKTAADGSADTLQMVQSIVEAPGYEAADPLRLIGRYDADGRLIEQQVEELVDGGIIPLPRWVPSMRKLFTRSADTHQDTMVCQVWDQLSGTWGNWQKTVLTYVPLTVSVYRQPTAATAEPEGLRADWSGDHLRVTVPEGSKVTDLVLYDLSGRVVARLNTRTLQTGRYEIPMKGQRLSGGVFLLSVRTSNGIRSIKVSQ
jgi:hypothetical protein